MVRNAKAVLWSTSKGNTNLDRSNELEKKTTKVNLIKIDLNEGEKLRENLRRKRKERIVQRKIERSSKYNKNNKVVEINYKKYEENISEYTNIVNKYNKLVKKY